MFVLQWNRHVQRIQEEAYAFYFVFKHPRTRWYAKLVAVCSAGSLFSPVQLIPSFIPVLGLMDDAFVLYMGAKLLYRLTPPDVLKQCHKLAKIATISKQEKVGPMPAAVASLVIATLWLFAAIASALMMTYVLHWRNSH
ncbi:MAG: YkvA family protein [Terriglobales bacterium]